MKGATTTSNDVTLELGRPEKSPAMARAERRKNGCSPIITLSFLALLAVSVIALACTIALWSRVSDLEAERGIVRFSGSNVIMTTSATPPEGYTASHSLLDGTGTWAAGPDMPTAKSDMQSIYCGNKVVVLGGLDSVGTVVGDVYTFDPVNEMYNGPMTPMPTPRYRFGAACKNGAVWVAGGFSNSTAGNMGWSLDTVDIYDVASNSWVGGPSMNNARGDLALAAVGSDLYAIGGYDWTYTALESVEKLASGASSWTAAASMSSPKGDLQAAVIDGLIYVPGGWNADSTFLNELDVYDPSTNSWSLGPSMAAARGDTAVVALDGKVFVIGGEMWSGVMSTCDWGWGPEECAVNLIPMHGVEMYDPILQVWTSMAPLPASRFRFAAAAVPPPAHSTHSEGALYAFGGHAHGEVAVTSMWNFHYVPRPNLFFHIKD